MLSLGFGSVWYKGNCTSSKEWFIKEKIVGRINDKYIDKKNHNFRTILFKNNTRRPMISGLERRIYKESVIGDSLYKKENSRILKLYKADGEVIEYEETEPDCDYLLK